jgi:hypothetical protein
VRSGTVNNPADGHVRRMRWHAPDQWIWSPERTHQAVVVRDDWQRVQAMTTAQVRAARSSEVTYPVRGRVFCAACGRRMTDQRQARRRCYYRSELRRARPGLDHPRPPAGRRRARGRSRPGSRRAARGSLRARASARDRPARRRIRRGCSGRAGAAPERSPVTVPVPRCPGWWRRPCHGHRSPAAHLRRRARDHRGTRQPRRLSLPTAEPNDRAQIYEASGSPPRTTRTLAPQCSRLRYRDAQPPCRRGTCGLRQLPHSRESCRWWRSESS